jgi:hypothetical protein
MAFGGCLVLPEEVGARVLAVLDAAPERFADELAALKRQLSSLGATADDVAHAERAVSNFRQVDRRLALDTITGLDDAGRMTLGAMDMTAWNRAVGYARSRVRMFRSARGRTGAIASVKGIIAEELFYSSRAFEAVMERARARAALLGFPPENVRFVRGTRGITLSERSGRWVNHGELTDGIIYVTRRVELSEAARAERLADRGRQFNWGVGRRGVVTDVNEDIHLLSLIESKSPSNVTDIAKNHGGNWLGQMDNDIERFSELPAFIDGRWYSPSQLTISHYRTEWVAVVPKNMRISDAILQSRGLKGKYRRLFTQAEQQVENDVLNRVAERMLDGL